MMRSFEMNTKSIYYFTLRHGLRALFIFITGTNINQLHAVGNITKQYNTPELQPFVSLCIEEAATGFNWENGSWIHANYRPDKRYLIQRIPAEKIKQGDGNNIPHLSCVLSSDNPLEIRRIGNHIFTNGCYNIRKQGEKLSGLSSKICSEQWIDGDLQKITCERNFQSTSFLPDGNYIMLPWHSDVSINPKDGRQDSLILSVGKCSIISQ